MWLRRRAPVFEKSQFSWRRHMLTNKSRVFVVMTVAGLVVAWSLDARSQPPNPFRPNESFVVTQSGTPLMRGEETVALLAQGQTLKAVQVNGPWIGTAVTVHGRKVGGWVWAGQAATVEQYAAKQISPRRRYSFSPAPGINQGSPNRQSRGTSRYGRSYQRADRKIKGL